jgi:hypothetical protein
VVSLIAAVWTGGVRFGSTRREASNSAANFFDVIRVGRAASISRRPELTRRAPDARVTFRQNPSSAMTSVEGAPTVRLTLATQS